MVAERSVLKNMVTYKNQNCIYWY